MKYYSVEVSYERPPDEGERFSWLVMEAASAVFDCAGIRFVHEYGMVFEDWFCLVEYDDEGALRRKLEELFSPELDVTEEMTVPRMSFWHGKAYRIQAGLYYGAETASDKVLSSGLTVQQAFDKKYGEGRDEVPQL